MSDAALPQVGWPLLLEHLAEREMAVVDFEYRDAERWGAETTAFLFPVVFEFP